MFSGNIQIWKQASLDSLSWWVKWKHEFEKGKKVKPTKQMPAVSLRDLDADSYLFFSRNSILLKEPASKQAHNICAFFWYFSDPAKELYSCTLLSRQIIIPVNLFIPLGRQSCCHLLVKSGTGLGVFQTVYSFLGGLIVQHKCHFLTRRPKGTQRQKSIKKVIKLQKKVITLSNWDKKSTSNSCQLL